ncbi:DoxX family membrane protein [Natronobacterium gregoryi]|uniref:DoxX family membrane protein n=2 Tax=Natronobacterium gregoryi TaxID=44930 RepID=L0AEP3_NATGS|nr:DoxX family membrane protein [Natronobacterium gregoryi]AFZ72383.1 DoxX protein [Natronobacterium gregoryi SP2]ELY64232.1 DoxX family protein [Natronobacterium gregoryi SP2]PLK20304.1 DoxX family membrane protein [Natronobacterium gregoryi SP2]SFJ21609.1 thiosulfate dehydrogenase [quinone] large subunit [Natronobacterium gregoryi]
MAATSENRLESRFGGVTLESNPHAISAWFVVALRFLMGGMMLFAGLGKFAFVGGEPFDASGYLVHGVDPASPVSGLYAAMGSNAALLEIINVVVPVTQVLIGVALILGAFVRLAALGGAMQMMMFYLGGWEGDWLALFDSALIYAVLLLALGAFAAGRMAGLDRYIEQLEVSGQPLGERYPKLRYLLG